MAKRSKKMAEMSTLDRLRRNHPGIKNSKTIVRIPYRSDLLNLFLGGVELGSFTEISGAPAMFKSTIAVEVAIEALKRGAIVAIHDKERKFKEERFQSLGMDSVMSNPNFFYYVDEFPEYRLTVKSYFDDMSQLWSGVRSEDLDVVRQRFLDDDVDDEMWEYYSQYLPPSKQGKKSTSRCKELGEKYLKTISVLREADRRMIVSILDSTTSVPSSKESPEMMPDGKVERTAKVNPAMQGVEWSEEMRRCMWLDSRVGGIHIGQLRMKLNLVGGPSYEKAAVTRTQEFYNSHRIMLKSRGNRFKLYRRSKTGEIVIGEKATMEDKAFEVGMIVNAKLTKNLTGIRTDIPLFMLAYRGTDPINSLWEFFHQNAIIKHHHGGRYLFEHPVFARVFAGTPNFTRVEFLTMYAERGAEMGRALRDYKEYLQTGELVDLQVTAPPAEE